MVVGEILCVWSAGAVDPIEKATLVLPRLPFRPCLVEKRDGHGWRYCELRHRLPERGARGRMNGIYLGRLSPLQKLAVRQAIDDTWAHGQRLSAQRHLRQISIQKRQYRHARKVVSVLAERAGFTLHGYALRKKNMNETTNTTLHEMGVPQTADDGPTRIDAQDADPTASLKEGLTGLISLTDRILAKEASCLIARMTRTGGKPKAADVLIFKSLRRLVEQRSLLVKDLARLATHGKER